MISIEDVTIGYGAQAVQIAEEPDDWCDFARNWLRDHQVPGTVAMLVAGPSARNPNANHRIEFLRLQAGPA